MEKFDEKKAKKLRVNYERIQKDNLYSDIEEIRVAIIGNIDIVENLASSLNYQTGKMHNAGTIFHNKISELSREFKNKGILFRVSNEEKYDYTEPSFIGRVLEENLLKIFFEAEEAFKYFNLYLNKLSIQKLQKYEELKSLSIVKKLVLKLKKDVTDDDFDFSLTDKETKELDFLLNRYKDITNTIFNYKIDENLITLITDKLLQYEQMGILRPGFDETNVSSYGFLKMQIIPELNKLGYTNLADSLEKTWIDMKKNDKQTTEEEKYIESKKQTKHKK